MIFGEERHPFQIEHAGLGPSQRVGIDVGAVEHRAIFQALFTHENRERIELFAGAAARNPHLERRISPQVRHDLLANRFEVTRVAE